MRIVFLLTTLSLLFWQCGGSQDKDDSGRDYPTVETFAAIDSCMGVMYDNPQKAHHTLDSLKSAKLMTEQRCDYFHAMVIYSGESNPDSALAICTRLLDEHEFGDDKYLEEEICVLASDIASSCTRHFETLKYANRGIAICHGNERMRSDEALLMARVGTAEQGLGRMDEARNTYSRAHQLLQERSSFGDFVALISLKKREAGLHKEVKEYDKAIGIYHEILAMVERFDRDPSFVKQRPETMQKAGSVTHDFTDFYQSQIYTQIARGYRLKVEQGLSANAMAETDSVRVYMDKWSMTEGSKQIGNIAEALPELYFAGRKQEVRAKMAQVEEMYKGDSLTTEFVEFLTFAANDAAANNDVQASNAYLKRAVAVNDSIRSHEMVRVLAEQMSLNMVQEHELARQDAESALKHHRIFILFQSAILLILIVAGAVVWRLIRKNKENEHIIEETQHDLTESKAEVEELVQRLEDTRAGKPIIDPEELFRRIVMVMEEEKPFLNPEFDISILAKSLGSSRSMVSLCVNKFTGKTFPQWVSEYKLKMFVKLLEETDEPMDALMIRSGYREQSTCRRQFKAAYGMSPSKYKKQFEKEKKASNSEETNVEETKSEE